MREQARAKRMAAHDHPPAAQPPEAAEAPGSLSVLV
jgi:hypothetical protein